MPKASKIIEAECLRCGESFVPAHAGDLTHYAREVPGSSTLVECGGDSLVTGEWTTTPSGDGGMRQASWTPVVPDLSKAPTEPYVVTDGAALWMEDGVLMHAPLGPAHRPIWEDRGEVEEHGEMTDDAPWRVAVKLALAALDAAAAAVDADVAAQRRAGRTW